MKRCSLCFLLFVLLSMTVFSQNNETLNFYKYGEIIKSINTDRISTIDFVKVPVFNIDFYDEAFELNSGEGRSSSLYVYSDCPWSAYVDVPWAHVITMNDSLRNYYGYRQFDNVVTVYASRNDGLEDRTGSLTIRDYSGKEHVFPIIQHDYTLMFSPYFSYPLTDNNQMIHYDDTTLSISFYPNYDWKILFCPDWLTPIDQTTLDKDEWNNYGNQNVLFQVTPNESPSSRTGYVIIEGHGQTIVDKITQGGLNSALSDLFESMTAGYFVFGSQEDETDMGYPGLMIAATEMLGDLYPLGDNAGYDWFRNYNTGENNGADLKRTFVPWATLYGYINSANKIINLILQADDNADAYTILGQAYAYRALCYYQLMTLYEAVENVYTDCSMVSGLTVPIITKESSDNKNIPRAHHEELMKFILSDLDSAEDYLRNYHRKDKYTPDTSVIYGLKARTYLWDKQYDKAAEYARKAIESSGCTPMTKEQYLDLYAGFNTANQSWMWSFRYDSSMMGNLCNYIGWISGEADWSYSSLTCPGIDKSLYDRISNSDFRKYCFIDKNQFNYYNYQTSRDQQFIMNAPPLLALKFRCQNLNWYDYSYGGAVDVPVMRVEEMYLIEAEALGVSKDLNEGLQKLNNFVQSFRDTEYHYQTNEIKEFQMECMWQKRIETWGEGVAFADAKRLQAGSMQYYQGSNAPSKVFHINAYGIKPWWNLVIPQKAIDENPAIVNNPDPTGCIPVEEVKMGEYWMPESMK